MPPSCETWAGGARVHQLFSSENTSPVSGACCPVAAFRPRYIDLIGKGKTFGFFLQLPDAWVLLRIAELAFSCIRL